MANLTRELLAAFNDCTYLKPIQMVLNQIEALSNDFCTISNLPMQYSIRQILSKYFHVGEFVQDKNLNSKIQEVVVCCIILLIRPISKLLLITTVDELKAQYPSFRAIKDEEEIAYLIKFRNHMCIALQVIVASSHKRLLMTCAGRLEGSNRSDFTSQSNRGYVQRRALIYECESGVKSRPKIVKQPIDKHQFSGILSSSSWSCRDTGEDMSTSSAILLNTLIEVEDRKEAAYALLDLNRRQSLPEKFLQSSEQEDDISSVSTAQSISLKASSPVRKLYPIGYGRFGPMELELHSGDFSPREAQTKKKRNCRLGNSSFLHGDREGERNK